MEDEPPSWAWASMNKLKEVGIAKNVFSIAHQLAPVQTDYDAIIDTLRESSSDAICLLSPTQYQDFMRKKYKDIHRIGKPIISFISEYTFGNIFGGYASFECERKWADIYVCGQDSDTLEFNRMGWPAITSKGWVCSDAFPDGLPWRDRIPKFVFIGNTTDYVPNMYDERRRVIAAFQKAGVLDVIQVEKSRHTMDKVAEIYGKYAGVLCPAANGRGHSIRLYEAASTGALIVEVGQTLDQGNNWFVDGVHRVSLPQGMSENDLIAWAKNFDIMAHKSIASAAQKLVRETMQPEVVWTENFKRATKYEF